MPTVTPTTSAGGQPTLGRYGVLPADADREYPVRRWLVIITVLAAVIGGFLFGFDTSTMNAAINGIKPALGLQPAQIGLVQSMSLLGCVLGAWFSGQVSLKVGRTIVMAIAGACILGGAVVAMLAGAVLAGAGSPIAALVIGRLFVGIGIGASSGVVPAYVTEVSPEAMRGTMGTLWEFAITGGQVLGLVVGFIISAAGGGEDGMALLGVESWRWMLSVVAIVGAIYLAVGVFLPASPTDLVRFGRKDEALALIARLGGEVPAEKVSRIEHSLEQARLHGGGFKSLLGGRFIFRNVVWIGLGLAVFQQILGINAIKNYSNAVWQSVGFKSADSFALSLLAVTVGLLATFAAVLIVHRVKARILLIIGTCMMIPSHLAMAWAFSRTDAHGALDPGTGLVALLAMMAFSIGFAFSWGPAMWLLLALIFDPGVRTIAMAFCATINWLTNWLVTLTFPILSASAPWVPFLFYAGTGVLALLFCIFALPKEQPGMAKH